MSQPPGSQDTFTGIRERAVQDGDVIIRLQYIMENGVCVGLRAKKFSNLTEYKAWEKSISSSTR